MTDAAADMPVSPIPAPNAYPVPDAGDDPRFTFGLASDVAALLKSAGYPQLSSGDFADLQLAAHRFLYGPREVRSSKKN